MKAWTICIALSLFSAAAIAQQQGGPPPGDQNQQGNGPPPGYQGQDNGPPPDYQDQQGNAPPPGYQGQDNGPPPGYQDQQDNGPPPGYQGQDNGPPPGYQDNGPPPGYGDPQDQGPPPGYDNQGYEGQQGNGPPPGYEDRQGGMPPDGRGQYDRPGNRGAAGSALRGAPAGRPGDGLGGWILVTSDENWQSKWETASTATPTFATVRDLARGKKAFALIFLANPKLDRAGQANVTCDIELTRPDGSVSTRQADAACLTGKLDGDARDTYLSAPVIGFVGDPRDPAGTWRIKVTLKDNNRHSSVPLQASFNLKN